MIDVTSIRHFSTRTSTTTVLALQQALNVPREQGKFSAINAALLEGFTWLTDYAVSQQWDAVVAVAAARAWYPGLVESMQDSLQGDPTPLLYLLCVKNQHNFSVQCGSDVLPGTFDTGTYRRYDLRTGVPYTDDVHASAWLACQRVTVGTTFNLLTAWHHYNRVEGGQ